MEVKDLDFIIESRKKSGYNKRYVVTINQTDRIFRDIEIQKRLKPAVIQQTTFRNAFTSYADNLKNYVHRKSNLLNRIIHSGTIISRIEHEMKELERIQAETERNAIESLKSEQQVIIQELELYKQHTETLQKYLIQLRSQQSLYRNFSKDTSKHVQDLKKQLRDLHNENMRLSNQIYNTTTSRSDIITKSKTITDVKPKTSFSKSSTSTLHLPSLNLNLLKEEEVSAFNDCTTEFHSLRTQLKRVRNLSQDLIATQTASTMECKELEEFFESAFETIMKVRPPALPIQQRSQSCRRYKKQQSILPTWDIFKSWPVSKLIETLNGSPSIMIRLHEEVFPNNLLNRRCIDFRKEVLGGSDSEFIRHIRSRTARRLMRSSTPFSWREII